MSIAETLDGKPVMVDGKPHRWLIIDGELVAVANRVWTHITWLRFNNGALAAKLERSGFSRFSARWTPRRRAVVMAIISDGCLSEDDVMAIFHLSPEELAGWGRIAA